MPKLPKGKRGLYILVDEVIHSKLWDFIRKKYDKNVYGALSFEVEKAIEYYLQAAGMHTNTHKFEDSTLPRTHRYCREIIRWLKDHYPGYERFTVSQIREAIMNVRGSDDRTLRKWLRNLVRLGYLKPVNNRVFKLSDAIHEADELLSKLRKGGYVDER